MALDGLFLNQLQKNIQSELPAKLNKIQQISDFEIIFNLYSNSGSKKLLISLHSSYNRIQFTKMNYHAIDAPSSFVMLLRKTIQSGIIKSVEQLGLDRILKFTIEAINDLGDLHVYSVYVELMGKYANIVLVDEDNRIVDAMKRIPPFENSKRTIHPGAQFVVPDPHDKKDPYLEPNYESDAFVKEYHGFSPLLASEMHYRIDHGQSFISVMNEIKESNSTYISHVQDKSYFHAIALTHLGVEARKYDLMDGLDVEFYDIEEKERIKQKTGNIFKTIRQEKNRNVKKLPKLLQSLDDAYDCERFREYGDLLFAYEYMIEKQPIITLESFETQQPVDIAIDMKYDIKTNAKKYYQKYHKQKRAQEILLGQIEACEQEIEYLSAVENQLEQASLVDADEIVEELIKGRYLRGKVNDSKKKKKKEPNYELYEAHGAKFYLGKNNLQNDYVTFKIARKQDTWFHAQGFHGAHVVVQSEELNEDIIRMAASLAAYYSQARSSSSVPVDYCSAKDVKKIPGSKAGLVSIKNQKTIYIDVDPNDIQALQEYRVK